jgi:DNA-binding NarL/FixJ family response regulator
VIRVVLVDDQQLVREGLRVVLAAVEGFDIVAECGDGASGARKRRCSTVPTSW